MMKNINWKKYAGATMAAAMIPALVAPIATEAAAVYGTFAVTEGKHVVVKIDGKTLTKAQSAQWFDKMQVKLVSQADGKEYYFGENGVVWVPAATGKAMVYDVHDVNGKQTSITVWPKGTTLAVLDYSDEATLNYEKVGVTFYQDGNYQGRSATFTEEGFYGEEALKGILDDNTISSIKIPKGYTVTLFEHYEGTGLFITLTEDTDLPEYFEDIFSSFKIEKSEAK